MKTTNIKEAKAQEIVREKNFVCTSNKHLKWAKDYLNRSFRRRTKQELKKGKIDDEEN